MSDLHVSVQRLVCYLGGMQMGRENSCIFIREGNQTKNPSLAILLKLYKGMKGLSAPPIKNKVALRASLTGSIFMDSVKVDHDALLPKSKGLGSAFSCLNNARSIVFFHSYLLNFFETIIFLGRPGMGSLGA